MDKQNIWICTLRNVRRVRGSENTINIARLERNFCMIPSPPAYTIGDKTERSFGELWKWKHVSSGFPHASVSARYRLMGSFMAKGKTTRRYLVPQLFVVYFWIQIQIQILGGGFPFPSASSSIFRVCIFRRCTCSTIFSQCSEHVQAKDTLLETQMPGTPRRLVLRAA